VRAVLTILPAIVAAACAATVPQVPGQGGPAWRELQSEHFTLWTDTSEARGRELIREMEDLRQVVIGTAFRGAAGEGRGFVIALRDDDEVHAYIPAQFAAIAVPPNGNPLRQPMIVLAAESNMMDSERLEAHELTHLVSHGVIHAQPHWFAEGLAKYFETIKIDARAGTVDVGLPPTQRNAPTRIHHLTSLTALMACEQLACMDAGFYATAWALFTYLTNEHPAQLAMLEQRMEELHGDGRGAWDQVFGLGSLETVDGELRRWLVSGNHTVLHFKVSLAPHAVAVRTLGDGDAYAVRALLRAKFGAGGLPAVAREVDAALAADPTNVLARIVDATLDRPHALAAARATAAAHPDDWRAWWLLTKALPAGEAAELASARDHACTLAAANPTLLVPAELRCVRDDPR